MIFISKNSEPEEFRNWKLAEQRAGIVPRYANLRGEPKIKVQESLLNEQGFICAYCQSQIVDKNALKIEHWKSQSADKTNHGHEVDYMNLLGVCYGERRIFDKFCEHNRGNRHLSVNPTNKSCMNTITYLEDGRIGSTDISISNDLNNILNLNSQTLRINRKKTWEGIETAIGFINKNKKQAGLQKILNKYTQKNSEGHLYPFCGIVIFFLQKTLAKIENQ